MWAKLGCSDATEIHPIDDALNQHSLCLESDHDGGLLVELRLVDILSPGVLARIGTLYLNSIECAPKTDPFAIFSGTTGDELRHESSGSSSSFKQ